MLSNSIVASPRSQIALPRSLSCTVAPLKSTTAHHQHAAGHRVRRPGCQLFSHCHYVHRATPHTARRIQQLKSRSQPARKQFQPPGFIFSVTKVTELQFVASPRPNPVRNRRADLRRLTTVFAARVVCLSHLLH
jgi:hypothetical protein